LPTLSCFTAVAGNAEPLFHVLLERNQGPQRAEGVNRHERDNDRPDNTEQRENDDDHQGGRPGENGYAVKRPEVRVPAREKIIDREIDQHHAEEPGDGHVIQVHARDIEAKCRKKHQGHSAEEDPEAEIKN